VGAAALGSLLIGGVLATAFSGGAGLKIADACGDGFDGGVGIAEVGFEAGEFGGFVAGLLPFEESFAGGFLFGTEFVELGGELFALGDGVEDGFPAADFVLGLGEASAEDLGIGEFGEEIG
jgi:hypothetical protein